MRIEFHADDYGLFTAQSQRILDCYRNGVLNGVSVMPNSPYLKETFPWLREVHKAAKGQPEEEIAVTIHLNFMEGRSLAGKEKAPDLSDENGNFNIGFGKLFLISFIPPLKRKYQKETKAELKAQIEAVLPLYQSMARAQADHGNPSETFVSPEGRGQAPDQTTAASVSVPIRLDGHGHYHLLPVIFDPLAELIREEHWNVTFIRVPREDVALYWRHRKEIHDFKAINFVKVAVLNFLAWRDKRKHPELFAKVKPYYFCGVMLSGHMSYENVKPILEDAIETAKKRGQDLELLFHPGSVLEDEDVQKLTNPDDVTFLTSPWRAKEADALKRLHTDQRCKRDEANCIF